MSFTRCTVVAALALSIPLAAFLHAQSVAAPPLDAPPASHETLPQIVRLSLAEGDVRVALPKRDAKLTGNAWEQATANIPLASGYSLATGPDGRAEIEFEDASTIYVGPNSALTFPDLITKDNVPQSAIALLSGTIILHVQPKVPGERYLLETPMCNIAVNYGDKNYSRVTSYLDGIHMTPFEGTELSFNGEPHSLPRGATYVFYEHAMYPKNIAPTPEFAAFDAWVAARLRSRDAAMTTVMHDAGLNTALPGLADLAGQGTFTDCAPYGTCWEPTHGWTQESNAADAAHPIQPVAEVQPSSNESSNHPSSNNQAKKSRRSSTPAGLAVSSANYLDDFPCDPYRRWYLRSQQLLNPVAYPPAAYPYDWAVCHAGFWIFRDHRYRWVAGTHKHHHCPVHWVKYHGKLAFVPVHPGDQRGKPPLNLRHGLFTITGRPQHPIERTALDGRSQPKLLDSTPKDFRSPAPPLLARADSPQLPVHMMHELPASFGSSLAGRRSAPVSTLTFNDHRQRFVLDTRVTDKAGRTHSFTQPLTQHGGQMTTHGSLADAGIRYGGGFSGSRGGSASRSSGYSGGGHSGGGYHGGGGGGGGHSGGGSTGGGGGGHSGGGGGSSAGGSSSGSSAGGAHH